MPTPPTGSVEPGRRALAEQRVLAMLAHLRKRTAAVAVVEANERAKPIGSGTCICIGGRFFVATAAHVIEGERVEDLTVLASSKITNVVPLLSGHGHRGGDIDDPVDVAWLELSESVTRRLDRTFIALDRVFLGPIASGCLAFIYGFPDARNELVSNEGRPLQRLGPIGYMTPTTTDPGSRQFQPDYDVFLDYPDTVHEDVPDGWLTVAPAAPGLSGSGLWIVNSSERGIWTADAAQLVAVQRTWLEGRWLRGTLMRHWLELVRDDLPELAGEIDAVLAR